MSISSLLANKNILKVFSFGSFIVVLFTIVLHFVEYFYPTNAVGNHFPFFKHDNFTSDINYWFKTCLLVFLASFSFRILMGILFIFNDKTYNEDKIEFNEEMIDKLTSVFNENTRSKVAKYDKIESLYKDTQKEYLKNEKEKLVKKEKEDSWEFFLGFLLIVNSLALNNLMWSSTFLSVMLLLGFMLLLILIFNIVFYNKIFVRDKERKANVLFLIGDCSALIITLFIFFDFLHDTKLFYVLFGGFLIVFFGEFITQYAQSIWIATKSVFKIIQDNYRKIRN